MKKLQNIINSLNPTKLPNGEVLYSFVEFHKVIKQICEDYVSSDDCIIMPYYALGEMRMELYEYELNIRLVDNLDFKKYLQEKTGKLKIDDIPEEVIFLQKNCYLEVLKTEHKVSVKKIEQYIDFLHNYDGLKRQVEQVFGRFEREGLRFEFY